MMGKMEIRSPPGSRPRDGRHCDLCGCSQPAVRCDKCGCQIFCLSCDDMYHRHPKRRFHLRKAVDPIPTVPQARPVLPVKVSHLNATNPGDPSKMPLPPPRKKKTSLFGSFRKPSPSSDNSPPLPKKEYSWTDRLGSIKKFMSNRPLPPLPNTDDNDGKHQPTTNGQSTRGDLTFIHRKNEERPPQLPQRSPRSPEFPGFSQEKENRIPSSIPGQIRNGSMEPNANHMNQNREFNNNEENHWNSRTINQNGNGPHAFGTLKRQGHQQGGFVAPGVPGYPGGMHQSSSATDLHSMHNPEAIPGGGPVPPHYPHYPMNPHMPPHYPYPMYHPQYPNYPQYFGNSFANISNPPTSEGDFSDSETSSRHSSRKQHFRKRAKRSQSVLVDRMAYPGQFFPFGPYPPGYGGPWGAPVPMEAPPSPASSVRSLNRAGRSRRKKKMTSEDDDEELSVSSSPMSRPKSSSSDPKDQPRAPLATQTTSSDDESDENILKRRSKMSTIRRQSEPVSAPSPVPERIQSPVKSPVSTAKLKQQSSKHSDSDARGTPEIRREKKPSVGSTTESPEPAQQKPPTPSVPSDAWECKHCTYINPISNRICQVCCKTATPLAETPVAGQSRPASAAATGRKQSVGSEQECASPETFYEVEDVEKKDKQDMASLNSALDEAEKQISKGLEELMKLKDDIDANISKEKPKVSSGKPPQPETQETSKPVYKSSGRMRTSILDKLNLNKPQTSNASVSTSTETQTGQSNWTSDKIIEARRHSNSSTTSETYNSPLAQSPDLERSPIANKQKRDSSCQTQQDTIAEYLEKRKAAEEAYLGRPVNNFGFGFGDRMDMVTSPVPSMYDRFFGGSYGMMQRSHSRASLFTGRINDFGPMDYGGPGFGYGPAPMYRSVSRSSLTGGEYPDGRLSEFHNLRKPDYYLSMEELVERRRQDNIRAQGLELVRMIREAEQQGFNADDIQVALTHCGKQNPLEWLQDNWRNMVDSVLTLSTNYGNDKKENDIGLLSENEARDALRLHKGNIWAAVTECVEGRQRKYLELVARGNNFPRQNIIDALTASDGDVEMAYAQLTKSTGKPFLMHIWGAGEGAQNQDGARPLPEDFQDSRRMYLKDETVNSDEMSEELWSEDGEWDEEDLYEEERGEFEDLQTCQEDLQTYHDDLQTCLEDLQASPQELMTPESEKSDYCDAFPVDDRNVSSPSDDIFFVIPEAKPEKKKGFLSKFTALRKDNKYVESNSSKDDIVPEPKEDTTSQKLSSVSEQSKNNGALSTLKNTLSAIKDTVTGGSKSDKKVPCAQPEKRTIIVKGQINQESVANESKNVHLTSVKPLHEDQQSSPTLQKRPDNSSTPVDELLHKVTKTENDTSSLNANLKDSHQSEPGKNISASPSSQVMPQSKIENKKPQSLAERLKFAKQNRGTTSTSSAVDIQKETSISDTKIKYKSNTESNTKEKLESNINYTAIQKETDTVRGTENNGTVITDMHVNSNVPQFQNKMTEPHSNSDTTVSETLVKNSQLINDYPIRASPSPQSMTKASNLKKNTTPSKTELISSKVLDSESVSKIETTTSEELSDKSKVRDGEKTTFKKSTTDTLTQNLSPVAKSPNKDNRVKSISPINSPNVVDRTENSNKANSGDIQRSEISKTTSSVSSSKTLAQLAKSSVENKEKRVDNSKNNSTSEKDLKRTTTPEISQVRTEIVKQTANNNTLENDTKSVIQNTLNKSPEIPKAVKDRQYNDSEIHENQNCSTKESLTKENNLEVQNSIIAENTITKNQNASDSSTNSQNAVTVDNSLSNIEHSGNSSDNILNIQSRTPTEISEIISIIPESKPDEVNTNKDLHGLNKSKVSTENHQQISSESFSMTQPVENLPAISVNQNIPGDIVEKPAVDNSTFDVKVINSTKNSMEMNKNSSVSTTKAIVDDQISSSSQSDTPKDVSVEIKNTNITPNENLVASSSSEVPQETELNQHITPIISEGQGAVSCPPTKDNTKGGPFKGNKVSKIKKSFGKDKTEIKDKKEMAEILPSSSSSDNQSSSIMHDEVNKFPNDSNSEKENLLTNDTAKETHENKLLIETASSEKEAINKEELKDNKIQHETEIADNELNAKTVEEANLQSSNELKSSLPLENVSEISDESAQNVATPGTEFKNNIPSLDNIDPSASKADKTETPEGSAASKPEQTVNSSKEIQNISTQLENNVSELQKLEVPNDNKDESINDVQVSSADIVKNSTNTTNSSETDQGDFKMMPPVSSTTFPEKPKKPTISLNTTTPDSSKNTAATSKETVPDSKAAVSNSSTATLHNSKNVEATSSTVASDNLKTTITTSTTTAIDSSRTVSANSSTPNLEPATVNSSASVPDTAEAAISTNDVNNSKGMETSSNTTVTDSSKSVETSSKVPSPSAAKTAVSIDASKVISSPSSPSTHDTSKTTASIKSTTIPDTSRTMPSSSNASVPSSSGNQMPSTSGAFKIIPNTKTSSKANNEIGEEVKSSLVQDEAEKHSKVPVNDNEETIVSDNVSSHGSAISEDENKSLNRTMSNDDSTSELVEYEDSEEDSDESRPSSVTPHNPIDTLRNRFETLAGATVRGGPIRPASPFRRMSFNSRKQVIALEKKRDTSADKPWFHQKILKEPVKIPQPKRTIKQQLEMERKVRKMVADRKCRTYKKAEIVVQLMDMNFEEDEAIQAANECSTLEQAVSYLQQECLLCTGNFPVSQIVSMTHCQHRACSDCIRAYFTVQIRDRTILDLLCPFCNEPDIGDEDIAQDYFNHLDIMLKKLVDVEIHELFQRKLRDRVLMKDPNFRWCSQCSSGFISMPNLKRLICPDCNAITCALCRRLWEKEHQGISCEAFAALKDASDPEAQAAGLAKLLTEDGIDCPSCHFRYALAKGGCMHFRCIQCQHDFCSGCSRPFKMGQKCGVSEFCSKLGLHAHHPRNCLFYLRDKEPEDLQKLLDMNDIKFNREPPEGMELRSVCQVMEQKETSDGMVDDYCGKEIQDGFAGLCRVHYVEYLGQLVNKHKVDPIQIFDNDDLELVLRRANIRLPPRRYRENDVQYRGKLVNLIQEELPLDKMDGS